MIDPEKSALACSKTSWQEREAYALENDQIQLVSLTGGGHVAEFRLRDSSGKPGMNPLWTPPWKTIDPDRYKAESDAARFSGPPNGRLLSGIAGHSICVDYFGGPSEEEAKLGLALHGEAPNLRWHETRSEVSGNSATLELGVDLPEAGLQFARAINLRPGEPVAYFRETVKNQRNTDHYFHWVQHVTLGPPFLTHDDSRIFVSANHGRTFKHGYEGKALLESARDFEWPNAPAVGGGTVDLARPFIRDGLGFLATLLLDPRRDVEYVAALNRQEHLLFAYCFRRGDFPWTALWEENRARSEPPWNGVCRSRGLEFGSTPFPVGKQEAFANGPLFGAPCFSTVAARGQNTANYLAFLIRVPDEFDEVADVRLEPGEIQVHGSARGAAQIVRVPASGVAASGLI